DLLLVPFLDGQQRHLFHFFNIQKVQSKPLVGIIRANVSKLLFTAIRLMAIRIRVREYSFAKCMQEDRAITPVNYFSSAAHRLDGVEWISAVAVDYRQTAQPPKILGHHWVRSLLGDRDRYSVAVVLNDEDDRQPLAACAVERFEYVAFRAGRLALAAKHDRVGVIVLDCAPEAGGVLSVVPGCR